MVALVLETAGEEPGASDPDRFTVDRAALDDRTVEPRGGRFEAGQREAALRAAYGDAVGLDQSGVDEVPEVTDVVVVRAVVDEHPQWNADLVGREADALGRVHGGVHVLDEPGERGAEVGDGFTGPVQHRITEQAHGTNQSGTAGDRAVSHGRNRTFHATSTFPAVPGCGRRAGHR